MKSLQNIDRAALETILALVGVTYRKVALWQGDYFGNNIKLYALDVTTFAYVEQIDQFEGGIVGYFFTDDSLQNQYDLQNWNVAPGVVINVLERFTDEVGIVPSRTNAANARREPISTVFEDGVYRNAVSTEDSYAQDVC